MKVFFDTSALTKKYISESGSDRVIEFFGKTEQRIISSICFPEMISTLSRLKREKLISQDQYAKLTVFIVEDLKNFYICEITTQVIRRAIALLEAHALKTLDAFQLACAVESQSQIFISADRQQIKVARKIGLKVETV